MKRVNLLAAMAFASVVGLAGCSDDGGTNPNGGLTDPPSPTGSVQLRITTTGEDRDGDGYIAALDCGCFEKVGINVVATMTDVEVGSHMVLLTGIADNCEVQSPNPTWVTVDAYETVELTFSIVCHGRRG